MKTRGILRPLDNLGRIVLPIEMRRSFDLAEHDRVEICMEGNSIVLRKYEPNCVFCGASRDLKEYHGKQICAKCAKSIGEL